MISKEEVIRIARRAKIRAEQIEKNYFIGLTLIALEQCPLTKGKFFLKGGTAIHMCFQNYPKNDNGDFDYSAETIEKYFNQGRFSSDIDLTTTSDMMNDASKLTEGFKQVADWLTDKMGISVPQEKLDFPIHNNPKTGRRNVRGYLSFKGPLFEESKGFGLPKLKIDITDTEHFVLEPSQHPVFFPYSDRDQIPGTRVALTYDFAEIFAEKFRAFSERSAARDLYDIVNLSKHPDFEKNFDKILSIVDEKFDFKKIHFPHSFQTFNERKSDFEDSWDESLLLQMSPSHGKSISFSNYWQDAEQVFGKVLNGYLSIKSPHQDRASATNLYRKASTFLKHCDRF